ncbi:hypothetical protein [Pseudomonas sp.]|uniref:hypothetical protein n=1 Tax=Pseudomonas sp. TaxID=306 RepID=UPI003267C1CA
MIRQLSVRSGHSKSAAAFQNTTKPSQLNMNLSNFTDRLFPMLEDALWAEKALESNDSQPTRRAYIRSVFAVIEGTVWILKQALLSAAAGPENHHSLRRGEYELLSDKSYELKNNGEIREQIKFLKLQDNIRFTYKMIERYTGTKFNLEINTRDWDNFVNAINVRNRITHPKTAAEFSISDNELIFCKQVTSWFNLLTMSAIKKLFLPPLPQLQSDTTID